MGGFLLSRGARPEAVQSALAVFSARQQELGAELAIGERRLFLFKKQWTAQLCKIAHPQSSLGGAACTGTLLYKGQLGTSATSQLARDICASSVAWEQLYGDYCFFIWEGQNLKILQSNNNLLHFYSNKNETLLSSSFLSVAEADRAQASINRDAIVQNLLTGCVFGQQTLLNNIKQVSNLEDVSQAFEFELIKPQSQGITPFGNRKQAVEAVTFELEQYFSNLAHALGDEPVSIGLSGGYDSRLLLAAMTWAGIRVFPHSHYKPIADSDTLVARELCEVAGAELISIPVDPVASLCKEKLYKNIEDSYLISDGNARVNLGWLTEYRLDKYRKDIANGAKIGLNGISGELFRNHLHLHTQSLVRHDFVREFVLEPLAWWSIVPQDRDQVIQMIDDVIRKDSHLLSAQGKNDLKSYHKFYRNSWVSHGPAIRNQIELPYWDFLSPFGERRISETALAASTHLGIEGEFEAQMIRRFHAPLARIHASNGRDFSRPHIRDFLSALGKSHTPYRARHLSRRLKLSRLQRSSTGSLHRLRSIFYSELNILQDLHLPILWENLLLQDWALHRAIASGYFLNKWS